MSRNMRLGVAVLLCAIPNALIAVSLGLGDRPWWEWSLIYAPLTLVVFLSGVIGGK